MDTMWILVADGPGRYFGKGERDHAHTSAPRVLPTEHEARPLRKGARRSSRQGARALASSRAR